MSVRVMNWVFEHSESKGNDRLVLLAVADRCGDDGEGCWYSTAKIAAKAKVSKRTAQRCIDNLVARGEVEAEIRPGTTTLLSVVMGRQSDAPATAVAADGTRGDNLTPPGATPLTRRQPVTGDTRGRGGVTRLSPDTSKNHPSPQPPASGGPIAHCDKHSKFRKGCNRCAIAARNAADAQTERDRTRTAGVLADIASARAAASPRPKDAG